VKDKRKNMKTGSKAKHVAKKKSAGTTGGGSGDDDETMTDAEEIFLSTIKPLELEGIKEGIDLFADQGEQHRVITLTRSCHVLTFSMHIYR
jgi:hypothetical protein